MEDLLKAFDNMSLNNPNASNAADATAAAGDDSDVIDDVIVDSQVSRPAPPSTPAKQTPNSDAAPSHSETDAGWLNVSGCVTSPYGICVEHGLSSVVR